jgi:hypothetical protein
MKRLGHGSVPWVLVVVLNVAWYFVATALALTICIALITPWLDVRGSNTHGSMIDIPVSFDVDAGALRVRAPALGVDTAKIQHVRGSMSFPPPGRASVVVPLMLVVFMLGLVLWAIGQLRAVLRTVRDRRPFAPENAGRIRKLGYAVIVGELARTALVFSANSYAMNHFSADGLRFDARPDLNLFAIVHGLIIFAIAEVFRAGTRLDEDQSLTI